MTQPPVRDPFLDYDFEEEEFEESSGINPKHIAAFGIALLILGGAIYFAFFTERPDSKLEKYSVDITIKDTEGLLIQENSVQIIDASSQTLVAEDSGSSIYRFSLEEGQYAVLVDSPEYGQTEFILRVLGDTSQEVVLERYPFLRITELDLPRSFDCNGEQSGFVTVRNSSSQDVEAQLLVEGFEYLNPSVQPSTLLVPAKASATATILFYPECLERGYKGKGTVRIRYAKSKKEHAYTLLPQG